MDCIDIKIQVDLQVHFEIKSTATEFTSSLILTIKVRNGHTQKLEKKSVSFFYAEVLQPTILE